MHLTLKSARPHGSRYTRPSSQARAAAAGPRRKQGSLTGRADGSGTPQRRQDRLT